MQSGMNIVSSTGSPPGRGGGKLICLVLHHGYRILTVGMANSLIHPPVTGAPINLAQLNLLNVSIEM